MLRNSFLTFLIILSFLVTKAQLVTIPIETEKHSIVLQTDKENHLRMVYSGKKMQSKTDYDLAYNQFNFNDGHTPGGYNYAYTPAGSNTLVEPAIQLVHGDGNTSLDLKYVKHESKQVDANTELTTVVLKDPNYKLEVTLFYKIWKTENVTEQWVEIKNNENKAVKLQKYASANLYFSEKNFFLTTYQGNWSGEMQPNEQKLNRGTYSVDTKLGTRAMLFQNNNFIIAFDKPATETEGEVMLGQIAWTGNFKMEFDLDSYKNLRLIAGINPFESEYSLQPGKVFKTPSLIYTFSSNGKGEASRNLHSWARNYRILDGKGERLTLLNNWESTYFDFNEEKLTSLIKDTKNLGVDMFLLDDGWFGNKYPRSGDKSGLGDWQETVNKLPHGLGYLVKEAEKEGVKFGIWIEPEMVNPKSSLFEKHPEWAIRQTDRPDKYMRNQLVLDLTNPKVQDFVYSVVDSLFIKNPGLAFIKWDCNAIIFNAYSAWLNKQKLPQTHLYVDYVNGLYKVLERIRAKYPKIPMMLCSGGGGRADYEVLKYFTEFWPSDNTDPMERIFMQWNYSNFFPAITTDNHVTDWGKQPLKFRVDVASMGKLGFDIVAGKLDLKDAEFCRNAIISYNYYKDAIWHGDLYRLVNPYENDYASLSYVNPAKTKVVLFSYLINYNNIISVENPVKMAGLNPLKKYSLKELNLYPGTKSVLDEKLSYSGDFLMNVGINPKLNKNRSSVILLIEEVK